MASKLAKTYKGNPPHGEAWNLLQTVKDGNQEWQIWRMPQEHSNEWATYKICSVGRAPKKANYWTALNEVTGQIGFTKDIASMRENRKGLYAKVTGIMDKIREDRIFQKAG